MKTALVTGAGRGLGKAFCDYLLNEGYDVFAGVRTLPKENTSPHLHPIQMDVSDDNSIKNAYVEIKGKTSSLTLLINNAGVNKDTATNNNKELVSDLNFLDRDKLLYMFNVNAVSPLLLTKTFLPLLNEDPSFVINVSSYRASFHDEVEENIANYGYRASKVALNMMTFASTIDLPKNIKTFAVNPGDMKTEMNPDGEFETITQAEKVINITKNWDEDYNGKFLKFDGTLYPL